MSNTDKDWQNWGAKDPYFGVLTDAEFRAHNIKEHREDFFRKGEEYIENILAVANAHFPGMEHKKAFDFGCGVGRLTIPISRRFDNVIGVDISQSMLDEATVNATKNDITNTTFKLSSDVIREEENSFDFVNTYIVLQHISVARGLQYIDQLVALLKKGGVVSLHFTVDRQQGRLRLALYEAQKRFSIVQKIANLLRGRPLSDSMMQMNEYPFVEVMKILNKYGLKDALVSFDNQESILALRVIAQKS